MSNHEESDEVSSHTLHDLLADLNAPSSSNAQLSATQGPTWTFPSTSSRSSPSMYGPGQSALFPRRASSREQSRSVPELDLTATSFPAQGSTIFNTPRSSIFASGPPTSSVSVNTAQASMSAPQSTNHSLPLSALAIPTSSTSRRPSSHQQTDTPSALSRKSRMSRVEKDVDDPSNSTEDPTLTDRRGSTTPNALARLFAATESTSPDISRPGNYDRGMSYTKYTKASTSETAPLPNHLYSRGLLDGRHSDITVQAFGKKYALHRLLLDRAPFFSSALSEPWSESSSKEISLHPEDIDSNITQEAFELALKRIYGCSQPEEEDKEAIGLFATGCWLEMADLIDSSVLSLLRQMCTANVGAMIKFATSNYYGKQGDRVLNSAKAMLCREGWEMPVRYWDGISGDIVREIIGGDGFYISGEWERFVLARRILNRRLRSRGMETGLLDRTGKVKRPLPESMNFHAVRFDAVYRKTSGFGRCTSEALDPWLALYTSPDIAALLVLLDEGIHYVHLSFEQLQKIRELRDMLGLPLMPEKVISNALWMSMELRQKIVNARELDLELGLSEVSEADVVSFSTDHDASLQTPDTNSSVSSLVLGKRPEAEKADLEEEDMESGSWDGNGKPRKFWIPHVDATYPMGGNYDAIIGAYGLRPALGRHVSRLSASLEPQDVQWASDFASAGQERPSTPHHTIANEPSPQISFTHYPPFRFAAEFPNPRALKDKKRVYSSTVWYAGSLWNVYVQKKETQKNTQLGVYLHRERHREGSDDHTHLPVSINNNVDEQIGRLEREMLMRRIGTRSRTEPQPDANMFADDDNSGSSADPDATLVPGPSSELDPRRQPTVLTGLLRAHTQGSAKASEIPASLTLSNLPDRALPASPDTEDDDLIRFSQRHKVPALPPYVDGRPTIKTYFKIYTPSKGGRMLSVYESTPDKFDFKQSWGWKSSNMVLDDGVMGYEEGSRSKDGKLRFMVVIGNV